MDKQELSWHQCSPQRLCLPHPWHCPRPEWKLGLGAAWDQWQDERMRGNSLKLHKEKFRRNFFVENIVRHWTGCPGQRWSLHPCRWHSVLWAGQPAGVRHRMDLVGLELFSSINGSGILWNLQPSHRGEGEGASHCPCCPKISARLDFLQSEHISGPLPPSKSHPKQSNYTWTTQFWGAAGAQESARKFCRRQTLCLHRKRKQIKKYLFEFQTEPLKQLSGAEQTHKTKTNATSPTLLGRVPPLIDW